MSVFEHFSDEPIHVTVPGSAQDPRIDTSIPGVVIHHVPELHPDDMTVLDGIPITSPSRTLIDCAECMDNNELRETFARARDRGLLDPDALPAARARVEWRASLAVLDEVIAELFGWSASYEIGTPWIVTGPSVGLSSVD